MESIKRLLIFFVVPAFVSVAFLTLFNGCQQPSCDNIPTEALAQVRILNAVSNVRMLAIFIDGKVFDSAWYNISNPYYTSHYLDGVFGYRSAYLDGFPLRAGLHHVVAKARYIGQDSLSTIVDTDVLFHGNRQSLVYIGKTGGSPAQAPRLLYLNDVLREPATASFARFIHAVPDINGSLDTGGLDVYFSDTITRLAGVLHPNLRIRFGHISHQNPDHSLSDNGTGVSADDYVQFPSRVPGLLIMPSGDDDTNDAIVSLPYNLGTAGILATIVIRGETRPVGSEPAASAIVLEDGLQALGTDSYETDAFGARILNAARLDSLTLLISSSNDQTPGSPRSVGHTPFSTQVRVTNISRDSVSQYMALSPDPAWYDFWFGPNSDPSGTLYGFTTNKGDTSIGHIIPPIKTNERVTFIAIDTIAHNVGNPGISLIELFDTASAPDDPTMGRIRFVNTSADYTASFTLDGTTFTMNQADIHSMDVPIGNGTQSFTVSDGNSGTATVHVTLTHGNPITIFFLPSDATHRIPYTVSTP